MFAHDAVWIIWDDVDALLVAFHTADVTADTLGDSKGIITLNFSGSLKYYDFQML